MQPLSDYPSAGQRAELLIHRLLERPLTWAPRQKIIYRNLFELTYAELHQRIQRLAHVLTRLGVRTGERVGVMDWDSHRYLECFFAIPMLGAALHTINTRLSPEQTLYTIQHADDRVLLVHPDFLPLLESIAPHLPNLRSIILLPDGPQDVHTPLPVAGAYESLLQTAPEAFAFPEFGEDTIATLFYTTGTTGDPKGVYFTHRQIVLHTLAAGFALATGEEPLALRGSDIYMPLTPMFHVHAWGVPYIATVLGLRQIYPGRYEPQTLLQLLETHQVTFSHCVPAILQMLLHHPGAGNVQWTRWKVIIGGAALPKGLAQQAMDRGMRIMGGYGMSETCPIIALAQIKPEDTHAGPAHHLDHLTRTGFPIPLVQAAIVDPEDRPQPPGPSHTGELVLRSPWLTAGYFKDPQRSRELWRGDWLHTGDLAYQDSEGYLRITDRLKDVIKIGGEWISSIELENALTQHPAVKEVAVVGVPDTKWDERPHAEVVLREDHAPTVTPKDLAHFLHGFIDRGTLHKRAILTVIHIVDSIPKTSVGKINKRQLRVSLRHPAATA
jgi:fatty-acyl-CoA synthase